MLFRSATSAAVSFDFDLNKFLKKLPIFIILSINISFVIHSIGKIKGISLTEYVKLIPNKQDNYIFLPIYCQCLYITIIIVDIRYEI